jgi:hypothetical protein
MPTSSADPAKLNQYSTDGLALIAALRPKATTLNEAITSLSSSGNRHVPAVGDVHTQFTDLVDDWFHLDEFCGDVANGFLSADHGPSSRVLTFDDSTIAQFGQVGSAARDEAILAAQEANRRLQELLRQRPEDIDQGELDQLFADIGRGQYDPAFAVTFSEAAGVHGYVDAMSLIRERYTTTEPYWQVNQQGLAYAAMLGTTLTTALDTVVQDEDDYRDPNNANLSPGDRLDYGFIEDLTQGYQGEDWTSGGPHAVNPDDLVYVREGSTPFDLEMNLSVLISYTDPPTWVAVDIANNRLSPRLEDYGADYGGGSSVYIWGEERSGIITNYADMLSRNSDASTQWLYYDTNGLEHDNVELALERVTDSDADGGRALAQIVENGLTNTTLNEPIPGAPDYVRGGPMREALMERVIDVTAAQGEINNDHMNEAFSAGVDANMNVIDERINAPFRYDEGQRPDGVIGEYQNVHDFLRETVRDPEAGMEVRQSVYEYGLEQIDDLPADPEEREARLRQLGRIQGVATEAEENAGMGPVIDEMLQNNEFGPKPGGPINYGLGFIPVVGTVNDVAGAMGISVGDGVNWLGEELLGQDYDNLSREEQEARVARAEDKLNRSIWLSTSLYDDTTPQGEELRQSAQGQSFVNPDGSLKTNMTEAEQQDFREWAVANVGNDVRQGPNYTDHGDITTGNTEVREGETDLNGRR